MSPYPIERYTPQHFRNNSVYYNNSSDYWQADPSAPALELPDMSALYEKYGKARLEGLTGIYVPDDAFIHAYAESVHILKRVYFNVEYKPGLNVLFNAVCPRCDDIREVIIPTTVALVQPEIEFISAGFTFPCHPNMEQYVAKFFSPLVIDPENIEYPDTRNWAQKRLGSLRGLLSAGKGNQVKAVTGETKRLRVEDIED